MTEMKKQIIQYCKVQMDKVGLQIIKLIGPTPADEDQWIWTWVEAEADEWERSSGRVNVSGMTEGGRGGGWVDMRMMKNKESIFHQSIHQRSHRFDFLSVFHLTVQIKVYEMMHVFGTCLEFIWKQVNIWDVSFHTKTCRTQNIEHRYWTVSFLQKQFLFL